MSKKDILFIIGTRPELIKIAPVIHKMRSSGKNNFTIISTGQHRELLSQYWSIFQIQPDYNLDIISPGQGLSTLTARAINSIDELIKSFIANGEMPKVILAQGDTTTVMAASIVAFYNRIQFVHLEAGLRSNDLQQPFPEEFNRRVAAIAANVHLSPTKIATANLLREGVPQKHIHEVGNTIVDALEFIRGSESFNHGSYNNPVLNDYMQHSLVLITCHRRENHGENLVSIVAALEQLIQVHNNLQFIWVWHPNPNVKQTIENSRLRSYPNFLLVDPLDYLDLIRLMKNCSVIITDSGGIQEEAPSFGKPLIVLREVTERPEAVNAGMAKLAGAKSAMIIDAFDWALKYRALHTANPYGDGKSAARILKVLEELL